ncbi:hypothetical protein [Desulfosporosinus sp. FKA]|uniref:hypothetical protein n=1 Tax=Desulfosporosinus sp. FKA TaxID=1969834 RepID=UPI001FA82E99|nr:hypothetical protein [Desulfosporosinus sp. FKA]
MQDPVLKTEIEEWEKLSDDPKIRAAYLSRLKFILDEKAAVRDAELRLKEAIEQGRKEGREEAKKEAKEEARKQGRKEGGKEFMLEVTQKLLKRGMDVKSISEITGLSEEEIKKFM